MSSVISASSSASVPEETAIAWRMPSIEESSRSSASISGPMMKRWLSQTRAIAARISSRSGRYCAWRSSSGTVCAIVRIFYRRALAPRLHRGARLPVGLAALDRLALVVVLLAFRKAHRHLHAAVLEIEPRRDQRHPLLDGLADQLSDLVAVEQQLAAAQRLVLGIAAVAVRADVHVVQEHFAVLDAREAVAQVHTAFANGLPLGAEQHEARLEGLAQME